MVQQVSETRIGIKTATVSIARNICSRKTCRGLTLQSARSPCRAYLVQCTANHTTSAWLPRSLQLPSEASPLQIASFKESISASTQPRILVMGLGMQSALYHLVQECQVCNILALVNPGLQEDWIQAQNPASPQGNELAVRYWEGSVASLPAYQGPFDAIYLAESMGSSASPTECLLQSSLRLKPGGILVAYQLLETAADGAEHELNLPSSQDLSEAVQNLPLEAISPCSPSHRPSPSTAEVTIFQKPLGYARKGLPLELRGPVVEGFGRGSKQLGFPTANLDPGPLQQALQPFPLGVYWGHAAVSGEGASDDPTEALAVVNIGQRPTYGDSPAISIEAHVLHSFPSDFYGRHMRVTLKGFIRPEVKFDGLGPLMDQIRMDIGAAKAAAAL
ncbi:hypothetical protein WJX84_006392 [Apatococcus fuscideae]|uniref:riboflavin kinase n=1 Tax=Apatococcus fuscideae TaxID=2026836 RepID=A0AAW1SPK1_9CHLO